MIRVDMQGCSVVRACSAHDLEMLTVCGWVLLGVITETVYETLQEQEAVGVPGGMSGSCPIPGYGAVMEVRRNRPIDRPIFILGRPMESALADAAEEIRKLGSKVADYEKACGHTRETIDIESKRADKAEVELKKTNERYATQREEHVKATTLSRKLEEDIAKIRIAIGQNAMNGIIGGA